MTLFYFNWFCSFTATSMHDSMLIFLSNFLFEVPNLLVYGLSDQPTNPAVNEKFPSLYVDGQIRKRYFKVYYILNAFLEGIV